MGAEHYGFEKRSSSPRKHFNSMSGIGWARSMYISLTFVSETDMDRYLHWIVGFFHAEHGASHQAGAWYYEADERSNQRLCGRNRTQTQRILTGYVQHAGLKRACVMAYSLRHMAATETV